MSETGWTKGPWIASFQGTWRIEWDDLYDFSIGYRNGGWIIASELIGPDAKANAHLIAASPDLYDLAVLFHSVLDNINLNMTNQDQMRDEVWKALAKARGEAP